MMMQRTLLKHHGSYLNDIIWHSRPINWTCTIFLECCGSANYQNSTVRTHYPSAHQPLLALLPRTYLLQTGSYDVSIHSWHLSVLLTDVFHPCCRHDIQTTAAVFYLSSSGSSARSSLYSRQAGVSGFWCHRLERPASPRRICAVTRGFQTTNQDFCFPVPTKTLSYDTIIHHYCLDTWSLQYLTLFRPR